MKYILLMLCFVVGVVRAADSISVILDKKVIAASIVLDATALRAEYAKKKAETGKSDAELRGYRETLILDAVTEAIRKARSAAE